MLEPDAGIAVRLIELLAHSGELAALAGENVCGHAVVDR
jgi:hypothetical protein